MNSNGVPAWVGSVDEMRGRPARTQTPCFLSEYDEMLKRECPAFGIPLETVDRILDAHDSDDGHFPLTALGHAIATQGDASVLIHAQRILGYESVRQGGSHIRLTTTMGGTHQVTVPNQQPALCSAGY